MHIDYTNHTWADSFVRWTAKQMEHATLQECLAFYQGSKDCIEDAYRHTDSIIEGQLPLLENVEKVRASLIEALGLYTAHLIQVLIYRDEQTKEEIINNVVAELLSAMRPLSLNKLLAYHHTRTNELDLRTIMQLLKAADISIGQAYLHLVAKSFEIQGAVKCG